MHDARPLPETADPAALASVVARRVPCVVRGAASGWPACSTWTLAHLRERLGARPVPVARLQERRLGIHPRRGVDFVTRDASRVLADLERGEDGFYLMAPLDALSGDLRGDAPLPPPCRGARWVSSKLWVSPAGAVSPLHFDVAHNLHAQIRGHKRFLVFERGHFATMYPEPPWSSVPNLSRVDPLRPDVARFPRFRRAVPWTCMLAPGDVIFLPRGTWHHVTSETAAISVNFWWARGASAWLARGADAWKRARGLSR